MPTDFLSLIGTVLNQRQRAAEAARSQDQFLRDLAFRQAEGAAERAAREREVADRMTLEREQFGGSQALDRERSAAQQRQFDASLGMDQQRLGTQGDQFLRELAFRGGESAAERAQREREMQFRNDLSEKEFLAGLAQQTSSPDVLDLLGSRIGVPGLGARRTLPSSVAAASPAAGRGATSASTPYRGGYIWDATSGFIPSGGIEWLTHLAQGVPRFPGAGRRRN